MAGALAARHTDKELEKGRVENTRVKRYWPGRAPAWVENQQQDAVPVDEALAQQVQRTAISAPVVVKKAADPRLARLAQRQVDREEAIEEHRQIRAAEVVRRRHQQGSSDEEESSADEDDDEEEQQAQQPEAEVDEEELQQRRDALKERLRQQQQQQDLLAAPGEEEEDEESSEYESGSDSDEDAGAPGRAKLVRPVFVRKQERETIAEREALEKQEQAAAEDQKQRLNERQQETRQLLVQVIAADEAAARAAAAPVALKEYGEIDTGDEAEQDAIEQWQRREAARIRRDHGERELAEAEAAEREKLRGMSEEERMAYLKAHPKEQSEKQKAKWKYLQKYWHKGAFFQSNADDTRGTAGASEVYARDYSGATGEDNFDKSALPEVMQVRNFGRSGRTKWKHLLAEDTSTARREDDWYRREEKLAGAVAGGYSRDAGVLGADGYGGAAKRSGEVLSQGFVKPKKFKT
eukprot:GHRQ01008945.1.p1 GENE.GHRQ01008945.1~~GHRQ01008945.1.p1  ORF type:complete len:466 (+),score=214.67 GHRQ01008945.1:232-1629(+)